ncbi:MAG TPA: hypothetical protein VF475_04770 [Sphingobium sp.]
MTTRKLSPWLVRSSVLAIGVSIVAFGASDPVSSQSFNATGYNVAAGYIDSVTTSAGVTNIALNSAQAVIDWTPDNGGTGEILFQAAGTTANFSRGGDFAVLNRIVPTDPSRPIRLDGNINGLVGFSAPTTGGTVFFYSPGGIIIGATARIDVGALGLTTASPQITTGTSGGFITTTGTNSIVTYSAVAAAQSQSAIIIEPSSVAGAAQINAPNNGSYVTLFAPVIKQNGIINVEGSAALVAASAGTVTWNDNGLFNVQVTTGTDGDASGVAIEHTGNTGGTTGGTAGSDYHRVYLVAVPKNTAITTLISGGSSLGFDVANAAAFSADGVVLTSGYNVSGDSPSTTAGGSGAADIVITDATFRSALNAYSNANVSLTAQGGATSILWGGATLTGATSASMIATGTGSLIDARRSVNLYSTAAGDDVIAAITGGNALVRSTNGGAITVTGSVSLDVSASGALVSTGGTAVVDITNGGTVALSGGLDMLADGQGSFDVPYGDGVGGTAQLFINGGGASLTLGSGLNLQANGYGASTDGPSGYVGGSGFGGTALIEVGSGTGAASLNVLDGVTYVNARGEGAQGWVATGGNGTGGTATISALANGTLNFADDVTVDARGISGDINQSGFAAGAAKGGFASLTSSGAGGLVSVSGSLTVDANGEYYRNDSANTGAGLTEGGTASISASAGRVTVTGSTLVSANAAAEFESFGPYGGGDALGGQASVSATGTGALEFTTLNFQANAVAGTAPQTGSASSATGGAASLSAQDSGSISLGLSTTGSANALGATGDELNGGDTIGGTVSFGQSGNGSITGTGDLFLSANGVGGDMSGQLGALTGGLGQGGSVDLYALGSGTLQVDGLLSVGANGNGGGGENFGSQLAYTGGIGRGGTVSVGAGDTATLLVGGSASINADGTGGSARSGDVAGGAGFGGTANLGVSGTGGIVDIRASGTNVSVTASGFGGAASGTSAGGAATGGTASVTGNGGSAFLGPVAVAANATGGSPQFSFGTGAGGAATGGRAAFYMENGAEAFVTASSGTALALTADARGGSQTFGTLGGSAVAGAVDVQALSGAAITVTGATSLSGAAFSGPGGTADGRRDLSVLPPNVWVRAQGGTIRLDGLMTAVADATAGDVFASNGAAGGSAYAGSISIVSNTVASGASSIETQDLVLRAAGTGGQAATAAQGGQSGASGGMGAGGQILLAGQGGNGFLQVGAVDASVTGLGGRGGDGSVLGGAGGVGRGGSVIAGTTQGIASSATSGGMSFGSLRLDASAVGGDGGLGFSGAATGAGGAATGGLARIVVTGSTVSGGDIGIQAGALSGDAGNSPNYTFPLGASGNATAGIVEVVITGRSGSIQSGRLQSGRVDGNAVANLGLGAAGSGVRYYTGGPIFSVSDGSANVTLVNMVVGGDLPSLTLATPAGRLVLNNAVVTVANDFTMTTPGNLSVFANQSTLNANSMSLNAGNFVADILGTSPATPGTLSAANGLVVNSGNDIIIAANLSSLTNLSLFAPGRVFAYDLTSSGDISVVAGGGAIALRNLSAGGLIDIDTAFALSLGTARAGSNILLDAGGDVTTAAMDAGDSVVLRSGAAVVTGAVTAGIVSPSSSSGARYDIGIYGLGSVSTGNLRAAGRVGLISGAGPLSAGTIQSGSDILLLSGGAVSATSIASTGNASRTIYIGNSSMVSGLPSTAFDPAPILASAPVAVNGNVSIGGPISGATLRFAATGSFSSGSISTQGQVSGTSGSMTTGAVTSASGPITLSGGTLSFGSMNSAGDVLLTSTGSLTAGAITASGGVTATGPGVVTLGDLDVGQGIVATGTAGVTVGNIVRSASVQLGSSGGTVGSGSIVSTGAVSLNGTAIAVTGPISASTLAFTSGGAAGFGGIFVDGDLTGSAASLTTGNLSAGSLIRLATTGDMTLGSMTGLGDIDLSSSGGSIALNSATASDSILVRAGNSVTISRFAVAGLVNPQTVPGVLTGSVAVSAGGEVRAGALAAARDVIVLANNGGITLTTAVPTTGQATTGRIDAGNDVLLMATNGVSVPGGITAGAAGRISLLSNSIASLGGTFGSGFDTAPIFAAVPVAMAGPISLGGTVTGGSLRAASNGAISIASGTLASLVDLRADSGLLSITGTLGAPTITLRSNDIAIGSAARIDAGDTGLISLYSTNAQGMRIGDGTAGTGGYVLDKAEFATLNSGSVAIGGVDGAAAVDMTIGDLEVTGPLAGSTIDDPNGVVTFYTGAQNAQAHSGTIRITGSLQGRGFLATNGIRFSTGTFELDAETGLLEILGGSTGVSGGGLSGTIFFDAPNIRVTQASILGKLAQNPRYAGRAAELNTPLSTARPNGVVRAGLIELGEADAVLVQNTGTAALPAGFLTTASTTLDRQTVPALGSVDLIINGQLLTDGNLLTGLAVRDFLVDDVNRPFFTPESSINGCALTAANCNPAIINTPPILQSDNLLVTQIAPAPTRPELEEGGTREETPEERRLRELAEKEAKSLPIPPPTPLIDTQPLNPQSDLDEPVSGSGNPSLIGGGVAGTTMGKGNQ